MFFEDVIDLILTLQY